MGSPTRNDSARLGDRAFRGGRRGHDPARAAVGGRLAHGQAEVVDTAGKLSGDALGGRRVGRQSDAERDPGRRGANGFDGGEEEAQGRQRTGLVRLFSAGVKNWATR